MQLRPATIDDLALLRRWDEQPHVVASDPHDDWAWEVELRRNPDWREQWIAEADGRPVGFLQVIDPAREESRYWGEAPAGLRALDLWIGEEADLGRGHGTEMIRLALDRCFADPSVAAVLVDPLVENVRAHRFYQRLGFRAVEQRRFGQDECLVHRLERADWTRGAGASRALGIAALAAGVATAGDLLMLWIANAARPELSLPAAPGPALAIGGALGVAAIPLYALGYRAVARALAPAAHTAARLVLACGLGAAALGAAIHGMTALAIRAGEEAGASPLAATAQHAPLVASWAVAALLVLIASAALVVGVSRSRWLPRRLAWLNPAAVTLVLALAGLPGETGRSFLLPAAPNLAHLVFFLAAGASLPRPAWRRRAARR